MLREEILGQKTLALYVSWESLTGTKTDAVAGRGGARL